MMAIKVAAIKMTETRRDVISSAVVGIPRLSVLERLEILDTRISRSLWSVKNLVR